MLYLKSFLKHTFQLFVIVNVIFIPVLAYFHLRGRCLIFVPRFSNTEFSCGQFESFFLNLLLINGFFLIFGVIENLFSIKQNARLDKSDRLIDKREAYKKQLLDDIKKGRT